MQSKASRTLFYRFVFVQAHLLARNGRGFNRRRRDPWELSELTISESRAVVWVLMTSMSLYGLLRTSVYAKRAVAGVARTDFCLMQGAVALSRIKMLPLAVPAGLH
jgi:hypothetical protein